MKKTILLAAVAAIIFSTQSVAAGFETGRPSILSMSSLAFGPDGVLFVGDGKRGEVFALDLGDTTPRESDEPLNIPNIESKIAAMLGTRTEHIMIHDMAVNQISQNIYLSVSKGGASWEEPWQLPNDLSDANILLKIAPDGTITEVPLKSVSYSSAHLPNPVDTAKTHMWKEGLSLRSDTITDMAYLDGVLFVAGLSNEEFASTMWKVPYPFKETATTTTLEIFHGAHGKWETHAPIRTFLPYTIKKEQRLLASYLCTPLVSFDVDDLKEGKHLKGRTLAEFGSGNYPLDMIVYKKEDKERLLIANSNLPLMIVDPAEIEAFEGSIDERVEGYTSGVSYEIRSGAGVQQLDNYNKKFFVMLRRLPGGNLDLESEDIRYF